MTVDRCHCRLYDCGPVVALCRGANGRSVPLCRRCLDDWFDAADDNPALEARNVWWLLEGSPA